MPDTLITQGKIKPELGQYLVRMGLIGQDGHNIGATQDTRLILEQYATGIGFERPVILFHVGEIFVRKYLATIHNQPNIDLAQVEAKFREIVSKFVADARGLRDYLNARVFVHEIPPPTANEENFLQVNNFVCPPVLRASVYETYNRVLREAASAGGLIMCETRDYMNDNGLLRAEYEFDGVHANPKYADMSLSRCLEIWLVGRTSDQTARYASWWKQLPMATDAARTPLTISEIFTPFTPEQIATIKQSMGSFEPAACSTPPLDWAHLPPTTNYPKFNSKITYADLSATGLKVLHDVLLGGPLYDIMKARLGGDFSIVNTRLVHSQAHGDDGIGPQFFHFDGCPPGIYRGLIYLTDVDENTGPFAYVPQPDAEPVLVTGKTGSLVLFDANAIKHRATPPRTANRIAIDLIILVHPARCPRIAHSRSKCTWPIDPYMFGLTDNCYPSVPSKRWFHAALLAPQATFKVVKTLTPEEMAFK